MTSDYYKYTGDRTGTELERCVYRAVRREIDDVLLETADGGRLRVTKEEWDAHLDFGTLEERMQF